MRRAELVDVARFAVRREPHHLVLGVVDVESEVRREGAVPESKRVREANLFEQLDCRAFGAAVRRGGPLTDGVHREDRRFVETGKEVGRSRVREVMADNLDRALEAQQLFDLPFGPHGVEPEERMWAQRRHLRQAHPELAVEFGDGVLVPGDAVDVGDRASRFRQAVAEGLLWKRGIVFDPAEALLLCRGDQSPSRRRQHAESWKCAEMPTMVHIHRCSASRSSVHTSRRRNNLRRGARTNPPRLR